MGSILHMKMMALNAPSKAFTDSSPPAHPPLARQRKYLRTILSPQQDLGPSFSSSLNSHNPLPAVILALA